MIGQGLDHVCGLSIDLRAGLLACIGRRPNAMAAAGG
jgi:hypothetical protein